MTDNTISNPPAAPTPVPFMLIWDGAEEPGLCVWCIKTMRRGQPFGIQHGDATQRVCLECLAQCHVYIGGLIAENPNPVGNPDSIAASLYALRNRMVEHMQRSLFEGWAAGTEVKDWINEIDAIAHAVAPWHSEA